MNTSICLSFVSAPALRWKNIMKGCLSDLMGSRNTHIKIPSQLCGGVGTGSSIRSEFPINMQRKDGGWLLSWSCLCFEELDMKFSTGACGVWSWHRQDCDLAVGLKPCLNSGFWCLTTSRTVLVITWSYWFVSVSRNWGNVSGNTDFSAEKEGKKSCSLVQGKGRDCFIKWMWHFCSLMAIFIVAG